MRRSIDATQRDGILDVVLEIVETAGYDAVQVRAVAKRAQVSNSTIYKLFATREALIFAALERWREANVYEGLDATVPNESLVDGLVRVFRHIFEPWEHQPRLLEAFHRVRTGPHGDQLSRDGTLVVRPVVRALFADEDPAYADDVTMILEHVVYGVVGRFVDGELESTDILPVIERTIRFVARPQPPTPS